MKIAHAALALAMGLLAVGRAAAQTCTVCDSCEDLPATQGTATVLGPFPNIDTFYVNIFSTDGSKFTSFLYPDTTTLSGPGYVAAASSPTASVCFSMDGLTSISPCLQTYRLVVNCIPAPGSTTCALKKFINTGSASNNPCEASPSATSAATSATPAATAAATTAPTAGTTPAATPAATTMPTTAATPAATAVPTQLAATQPTTTAATPAAKSITAAGTPAPTTKAGSAQGVATPAATSTPAATPAITSASSAGANINTASSNTVSGCVCACCSTSGCVPGEADIKFAAAGGTSGCTVDYCHSVFPDVCPASGSPGTSTAVYVAGAPAPAPTSGAARATAQFAIGLAAIGALAMLL
ncbi:hypothetical protein WJX72_007224 [[Myrmecia] bisecta]|uniref:Uncharacterized protein n=1 Tax=[Myrmecia] bisecta TaxID=41462 RepID=A0AAW1PE29_9CHLO